jgi:hypothetical protein
VVAALAQRYWRLSDQPCRSSGFVLGDGADDADARAQIRRCQALAD